jgi:outer membrane protein
MIAIAKKKITGILLATLVLLGATGINAAQPAKAHAAAPTSGAIGVVDFTLLINQHQDTQKANETLKAETETAKKEFADKSAGLSDADKQNLNLQLMQRVEQKRQELLKAIADKISAAVKEVAAAKGLEIVVQKGIVVYGGVDITDDVMKKISGK